MLPPKKLKKRIEELRGNIKIHQKNSRYMVDFFCGTKNLKKKHYSIKAQNYQRAAEDDARFIFTLKNLRAQIQEAQQELNSLAGAL